MMEWSGFVTPLINIYKFFKNIDKNKKRQKYLKQKCNRIKDSIENDIIAAQNEINLRGNCSTVAGQILTIYSKIEKNKEFFSECKDEELKFWFDLYYEKLPSSLSPDGKLSPEIDINGTRIIFYFKKNFCKLTSVLK